MKYTHRKPSKYMNAIDVSRGAVRVCIVTTRHDVIVNCTNGNRTVHCSLTLEELSRALLDSPLLQIKTANP